MPRWRAFNDHRLDRPQRPCGRGQAKLLFSGAGGSSDGWRSGSGRRIGAVAAGCAVLWLAGCAVPAGHHYSLRPTGLSPAGQTADFAVHVLPVAVPKALDRPQIVVRLTPDAAAVSPLTGYLWAAPLSDDLRLAWSEVLAARLGVLDLPARQAPAGLPVWQVAAQVQRFDAVYDQYIDLETSWRLARDDGQGPVVACRMQLRRPVAGEGVGAVVTAWRDAWQEVAGIVAAQLAAPQQTPERRAGLICATGPTRAAG